MDIVCADCKAASRCSKRCQIKHWTAVRTKVCNGKIEAASEVCARRGLPEGPAEAESEDSFLAFVEACKMAIDLILANMSRAEDLD